MKDREDATIERWLNMIYIEYHNDAWMQRTQQPGFNANHDRAVYEAYRRNRMRQLMERESKYAVA